MENVRKRQWRSGLKCLLCEKELGEPIMSGSALIAFVLVYPHISSGLGTFALEKIFQGNPLQKRKTSEALEELYKAGLFSRRCGVDPEYALTEKGEETYSRVFDFFKGRSVT